MKSVLLVFSKQDDALQRRLYDAFEAAKVSIDAERSIGQVAARIEGKQYNYVICGLHLASDADSPVMTDGGLRLCEEVRGASQAPIALIVPGQSNEVQLRAATIPTPPLVLMDEGNLAKTLVGLLDKVKIAPARLDILIRAPEHSDWWSYEMHGHGVYYDKNGEIHADPDLLDAQRALSRGLLNEARWYDSFNFLGKNILNGLRKTKNFDTHLKDGLDKVGGVGNTRLTFSVARSHYQIALEAIQRPDRVAEPWMVHAPLIRNIRDAAPANSSLFEGPVRQLRCLMICADTSGIVHEVTGEDGNPTVLRELDEIRTECENLKKMLEKSKIEVCPIGFAEDREPLTSNRLLNVLRSRRWDLIHYAGHSKFKYTENNNKEAVEERAYLFVGQRNAPEAIEFDRIASYMKRAKLLYLSSCESANAAFAVEAANAGVPAVIGFRWRIADAEAARHAHLFYESLFREQAIDTAFLNVRKAIHDENRDNNTWASSMLVMNG